MVPTDRATYLTMTEGTYVLEVFCKVTTVASIGKNNMERSTYSMVVVGKTWAGGNQHRYCVAGPVDRSKQGGAHPLDF